MLIIFIVLLVVINRTVDKEIVAGINNLAASMKKIASGDFEIIVKEESNSEFIQLSGDINTMVEELNSSADASAEVTKTTKEAVATIFNTQKPMN